MIATALVLLTLGVQSAQQESTLSTGPYNAQWQKSSVAGLANADFVAIVEPLTRLERQKRGGSEYVVDTFRVVDSLDEKSGQTLTVVTPQHGAKLGAFAAKRFLLLAERAKAGKLIFRDTSTGKSLSTSDANTGEAVGEVLLPTSVARIVKDQDVLRSYLRSSAEALAAQSGANSQAVARFLIPLQYTSNDRFGTLTAKEWMVLFVSGDIHRGLPGAPIATQMLAHIVDIGWQVPGSVQAFLNQMPAAEADLDVEARETWLSLLWSVDPSWAGVAPNDLVKSFSAAKTYPAHDFVLRALNQLPTKRSYEKLLDGLTDPNLEVRFALLRTLAKLDNKPDLMPEWTIDARGDRHIKDEGKLDSYWNRRG